MGNTEYGVQMRNTECLVTNRISKYGMRNTEYGVKNAEYGVFGHKSKRVTPYSAFLLRINGTLSLWYPINTE